LGLGVVWVEEKEEEDMKKNKKQRRKKITRFGQPIGSQFLMKTTRKTICWVSLERRKTFKCIFVSA